MRPLYASRKLLLGGTLWLPSRAIVTFGAKGIELVSITPHKNVIPLCPKESFATFLAFGFKPPVPNLLRVLYRHHLRPPFALSARAERNWGIRQSGNVPPLADYSFMFFAIFSKTDFARASDVVPLYVSECWHLSLRHLTSAEPSTIDPRIISWAHFGHSADTFTFHISGGVKSES